MPAAVVHTGSMSMPGVGSAMVAAVLTVVVWPALKVVVTVAHEGGHALTTSIMGGRVHSIRVHRTGGGVTATKGLGAFGGFLTALAGYIGPSVFGVAGALLLVAHCRRSSSGPA